MLLNGLMASTMMLAWKQQPCQVLLPGSMHNRQQLAACDAAHAYPQLFPHTASVHALVHLPAAAQHVKQGHVGPAYSRL